jgi:hypothetical protein
MALSRHPQRTAAWGALALWALTACGQVQLGGAAGAGTPGAAEGSVARMITSLDGTWRIATDPANVGRAESWWQAPRPEAVDTRVPWIIQDAFPGYHGVAWYWRNFTAPALPAGTPRVLLRFWAVDYLAEVWLNGVPVGGHEGAETPFVLDVTDALRPGQDNRVTVRVLNPSHERIDGYVLAEVPHRHKVIPYSAGAAANHGGITDSVELLVVPTVRIEDLFVRPNWTSGRIRVQAVVRNAGQTPTRGRLALVVAPAAGGETLATARADGEWPAGDTPVEVDLQVHGHRLWELTDPFLYRVSVRLTTGDGTSSDEQSTRCGFRDFRFANGSFRLNGKRAYLKGSHSCNHFPVGLQVPDSPDLARRDLLYAKMSGFNCIRFIAGLPTRYQLDLCDELGLLVYEENYASWCLGNSPQMAERYDRSFTEMIRRDRNHPAIVIWGMLNETQDGPVFRHAVEARRLVRALDDTRLLILDSGRFDLQVMVGSICNPGATEWEFLLGNQSPDAKPAQWSGLCGYVAGAGDVHCYPGVPQTYDTLHLLRTMGEGEKNPVLLTEYGIGSAVNWPRICRQFEQLGKTGGEDAQFYQRIRDRFLADWALYRMADTWADPDDYFNDCLAKMASQRRESLNAIRANPHLVGHSMTGTVDQGMTGEGLWTLFRELKPGTMDALFESWAPLKWCLFVERENVYRGAEVRLDAVLANEDVLRPGDYPVRLQVVGPNGERAFEKTVTLTIPAPIPGVAGSEPPFALPVFSGAVAIDGPTGRYRFLARFEKGAAATCGEAVFYVADPADMPKVETEVLLWGDDPGLAAWLAAQGIATRPFAGAPQMARELILVGAKPAATGAPAWRDLITRITRGAAVVFLCPEVFAEGDQPTRWVPLVGKGSFSAGSDLYIRDEWAKRHPLFAGLPAGGLLDYTFYREIVPSQAFCNQDPPTEIAAAGIRAAIHPSGYASGYLASVYRTGAGMYVLNTLRIRETLGPNPVAERLLRNMLCYAARDLGKPLAELPGDWEAQLERIRFP